MASTCWFCAKPRKLSVPAPENCQLRNFTFRELEVATNNFSDENCMGGVVFKGCLQDGSLVNIQRLKKEHAHAGDGEFQRVLAEITAVVHQNLHRLLGFCVTLSERLVVYPYKANNTVASHLRGRPLDQPPLDWSIRKGIAIGTARGLSYLHDQCNPKIIHRNVKAANILLDEEFNPAIGGFELAKLMDSKETHVITAVLGTFGHISPEYITSGRCSEKTDAYGYGIMLLELITGQKSFDFTRLENDENVMLLDWVKVLAKEKKFELLVDKDVVQNCYVETEIEQLVEVALLCTQSFHEYRPKMSEVVRLLESGGLAEKWNEWQNVRITHHHPRMEIASQSDHNHASNIDSTQNLLAVELSGPR